MIAGWNRRVHSVLAINAVLDAVLKRVVRNPDLSTKGRFVRESKKGLIPKPSKSASITQMTWRPNYSSRMVCSRESQENASDNVIGPLRPSHPSLDDLDADAEIFLHRTNDFILHAV
jgi:hypothetical protein